MQCTLCHSNTIFFEECKSKKYYKCPTCLGILLCESHYLNAEKEKNRYDKHSDNIEDKGYKKFVSPIINAVQKEYSPSDNGLDYGCGNSAIIQQLLNNEGYTVNGYDPFYFPQKKVLNKQYNYITCCEVVEHFYTPRKEFQRLNSLLKKGGKLYLKTNLFNETINFKKWWYKNDATHVFFYTKETMEYIKTHFGFKSVIFESNHIEFSK